MHFDDYRDSWSLRADQVRTLEQAREVLADHLSLVLDLGDPAEQARGKALVAELRSILAAFTGGGLPVRTSTRMRAAAPDLWRLPLGQCLWSQPRDHMRNAGLPPTAAGHT